MNCLLVMKIKWSLDINTGAVERSEAARARRLAGATVVPGTVVGPVTARADQLWHAETGPPDQIWRRTNYCVTVQLEPYGAHSASRPITRCILRCILQKVHKLIKRYRFGSMTLTIEICSGQIFHSKDGLP